jgi:hypothetical protein
MRRRFLPDLAGCVLAGLPAGAIKTVRLTIKEELCQPRLVRIALCAAAMLAAPVFAAGPSSTNYALPSSVLNAGGGDIASGSYTMSSSLGDSTFSGAMSSAGYKLSSGLWGFVGTTTKQVVVEYRNTANFPGSPGGHFFYTAEPAEQAAVDAGAAGAFVRTGRQFLTGGIAPVCRFYGSVTPGPNSHFFTVDVAECNALKAAQITPTPATVQQWNYEGLGFSTTPAFAAAGGVRSCPVHTLPVYRAYNNAFPPSGPKNPWDSNHRYSPQLADIAAMVAGGWHDEGIVFCTAQ